MQKAEYRYYEISRDIPVLVLTGEKWETIYGTDRMTIRSSFLKA